MYNKDIVFQDIMKYVNMKQSEKISFIINNTEQVMDMLDYFVDITKDR